MVRAGRGGPRGGPRGLNAGPVRPKLAAMSPRDPGRPRERAINIPTALLAAIALLVAIHAVRVWLDEAEDVRLLLAFSFIPAPWSIALGYAGPDDIVRATEQAGGDPDAQELRAALARYVAQQGAGAWTWLTYSALHGSWMHLGLNGVWLAAFGTSVVRRAGGLRSLGVAAAAAIGGAAAQWLSDPLGVQPVIGASAVVSGFMAAAATFIFAGPQAAFRWPPQPVRRWDFLRNRNALVFLAVWFAGNLLFGLAAVPLDLADGAAVAWQAHIGGLVAGLVLFPLLDPGPSPRMEHGAAP